MSEKGKLDWVQGLRGIAALAVVICHARNLVLANPYGPGVELALRPLAMGVDLFFLVSGFIMVYTTTRSDGSASYAAEFLVKRFARVWPVYAVMVVLFMGYAYSWHMGSVAWAPVLRSLAFLPIDARKPPYFELPYGLGWTLNFEMYFYLVFGASMLAGRFRWVAFFGWMGTTLVGVPLLVAHRLSMQANNDYGLGAAYLDQITNPIIWDFVAGVVIGLAYRSRLILGSREAAWLLVAGGSTACLWLAETGRTTFHGITNWGAPLALIFFVMSAAFKKRSPVVPRWLLWLGNVSFSLYLVHLIVFSELEVLVTSLGHPAWATSPAFALLAIAATLVAAEISRRLLENGVAEEIRKLLLRLIRSKHAGRYTGGANSVPFHPHPIQAPESPNGTSVTPSGASSPPVDVSAFPSQTNALITTPSTIQA